MQEEINLHSRMAQQYLSQKRPELATDEFRAIIALDPRNVDALADLGVLLFFRGDFIDAAPQLDAALKLQPGLWKIQLLLGVSEVRNGNLSKGQQDLETAFPHVEEQNIRVEAGKELVTIYVSTGKFDRAAMIRDELSRMFQSAGEKGRDSPGERLRLGELGAQRAKYIGDSACLRCHSRQGVFYLKTAHHLTSQLENRDSILGSFAQGANVLNIRQPSSLELGLSFSMEKKGDGHYITAAMGTVSHMQSQTERIDIIVGSGVRGQSYLYWHDNDLYELPVSYWSNGRQWINSPGYADGTADFTRPINPRCLECHASYIRALSSDFRANTYDIGSLVTGISCETCHGPGGDHVAARSGTDTTVETQAILNPARFSRDRQVDLCALCHNGIRRKEITPAFSYLPGQPLNDHLRPNVDDDVDHPEVHGNQVGLLKRSRCYLASPTMSCATCHDVHAPERSAVLYSAKCLTCHRWESCGVSKVEGEKITENCIDCHMPLETTKLIVSDTAGRVAHAAMRNHWIKVYRGEQQH